MLDLDDDKNQIIICIFLGIFSDLNFNFQVQMRFSCFKGAVPQHNTQLHEGRAGVSLYWAVLFSTWSGRNGAHCSCQSTLPSPPGCTYRHKHLLHLFICKCELHCLIVSAFLPELYTVTVLTEAAMMGTDTDGDVLVYLDMAQVVWPVSHYLTAL